MKASAWKDTASTVVGNIYGIRVGVPNREKHFKDVGNTVKVEIEGVLHDFRILDGFWRSCPEIRDTEDGKIWEWLERHHSLVWEVGHHHNWN